MYKITVFIYQCNGQTYIIFMRFCFNIYMYIDLSVVYVEEKIHEYQAQDEWRKLQI